MSPFIYLVSLHSYDSTYLALSVAFSSLQPPNLGFGFA